MHILITSETRAHLEVAQGDTGTCSDLLVRALKQFNIVLHSLQGGRGVTSVLTECVLADTSHD